MEMMQTWNQKLYYIVGIDNQILFEQYAANN